MVVVIIDSGAALSVVTEKVCEVHGFKVKNSSSFYTIADGSSAKLLGVTNLAL
mgnify:FL=1